MLFIGVATINNIYGQTSKAAPITNSDFRPGLQLMGGLGLGLCPIGSLYMEALGSNKILREGTYLASSFLFFSIGYSFHF